MSDNIGRRNAIYGDLGAFGATVPRLLCGVLELESGRKTKLPSEEVLVICHRNSES